MKMDLLTKEELTKIYKEHMVEDFPPNELKPLDMLYEVMDQGRYVCYGLKDNGEIIGYALLIKNEDDYLIDYLAIYPSRRDQGNGSHILKFLREELPKTGAQSVIAEVENPDFAADEEERQVQLRRLSFYKRNGCIDSGARVECFKAHFILIDIGEELSHTKEEMKELYAMHLRSIIPEEKFLANVKLEDRKKAVIFDMYETLITLWGSTPYMGRQLSKDAGIEESKFREIWDTSDDDRTLGKVTTEEVIEKILKANNRYSYELFQELIGKRKNSKIESFNHIHPDIIPMFEELKKKGIKIGLITNCFNEEKEVIRNSILFPYFDVVCMSCELGLKKPDQEIFDLCVEKLKVPKEDCIYCGDGGSKELETAKALNMLPLQALWYLKEGVGQPVGRLEDFIGVPNPMDVLLYLND